MSKIALIAAALCGLVAHADTTIRMKMTSGKGSAQETAMFTKGARQRTETVKDMAIIQQKDKSQMVLLDGRTKTFTILAHPGATAPAEAGTKTPDASPAKSVRKGGVVRVTSDAADTGERKTLFGYEARHIKTVVSHDAGPDTCHPGKTRMEADGWYIDWQPDLADAKADGGTAGTSVAAACTDEYQMESKGAAKLGYPVAYVMKTWQGDNPEPTVIEYEVTELSKDPLAAAMFEIPEGYTQAGNMQAMAAQMATAAAGSKREGMKRIGIVAPGTIAAQLQGMIHSENVEAVALTAADQAQRMECDYFLTANPGAVASESAPAPKKKGLFGAIAKATAGVDTGAGQTVAYRLVRVSDNSELLNATEGGKSGGFGLRNALQLASTVQGAGLMSRAMGSNYYAANAMQSMLWRAASGGQGASALGMAPAMFGGMGGYWGALSTVQYAASTATAGNGVAPNADVQPALEKIAKAVLAATK